MTFDIGPNTAGIAYTLIFFRYVLPILAAAAIPLGGWLFFRRISNADRTSSRIHPMAILFLFAAVLLVAATVGAFN